MKVLVTGASGHLGAHLARELLWDGYDVRALVRKSSCLSGLRGLDIEVVTGDVLNEDSLITAMSGCRHVFHLGCPTGLEKGLFETITKGVQNVLSACQKTKIDRLVLTSSVVTIGYSDSPEEILDERANNLTEASPYHAGKWHAEKSALNSARAVGLDLVVTNPATIIGALDFRVTPSNAPIQRCMERGLRVAFDSGLTVVHVRDVARGHLLALKHGRSYERYILGGTRVTIPDYFNQISQVCGRPSPKLVLPRAAILCAGAGFSLLNSLGMKVPFTLQQARHLAGRYGWYSSSKAVEELGYSWSPLRDSIKSYVDWRCEPSLSEQSVCNPVGKRGR